MDIFRTDEVRGSEDAQFDLRGAGGLGFGAENRMRWKHAADAPLVIRCAGLLNSPTEKPRF